MKRLNVTVFCQAVYNSYIDVPDNLSLEEAIEYAKNHTEDIPLSELDYISNSDDIDAENCEFDKEIPEIPATIVPKED